MANLYEINQSLMECIDYETGEIIDIEKMNALMFERDEKIENIALWIKNLKNEVESYKAEAEAFLERKKSAENKIESLSRYLSEFLDGQNYRTTRAQISFRNTTAVKIDENAELPSEYCRVVTKTDPDKKAIKTALESGIEIEGCELVKSRSMMIK